MNRLPTRAPAALAATLLAVLAMLVTYVAPATAGSGPGSGDDSGHGSGQGSGHGDDHGGGHGNGHGGHGFASIPLPNGFSPEDITAGPHHTFYVGSLATGGIYQGNFRSTTGTMLVAASDNGGPTTGLYLQERRGHDWLWAAGGPTGEARVYDATTGALLHSWQLADPATSGPIFISDVVTSSHHAYYTDAFKQQLYVIDIDTGVATTVPLTGDVVYQEPATGGTFNLNGLAVFKHRMLVSGQTVTGNLYAIDPATGVTTLIPLTDKQGNPTSVPGADGIAQRGNKLYIAQNFPQKLATVKISSHLTSARLIAQVTDPALDIPSSVEEDRGNLYGLNARFGSPNTADKTYSIIRVDKS